MLKLRLKQKYCLQPLSVSEMIKYHPFSMAQQISSCSGRDSFERDIRKRQKSVDRSFKCSHSNEKKENYREGRLPFLLRGLNEIVLLHLLAYVVLRGLAFQISLMTLLNEAFSFFEIVFIRFHE